MADLEIVISNSSEQAAEKRVPFFQSLSTNGNSVEIPNPFSFVLSFVEG